MEIDRANSDPQALVKLDAWLALGKEIPSASVLNYNGIRMLGQMDVLHSFTIFKDTGKIISETKPEKHLKLCPEELWSIYVFDEPMSNDKNLVPIMINNKIAHMLTLADGIRERIGWDEKYPEKEKEKEQLQRKLDLPLHGKYMARNALVLKNYAKQHGEFKDGKMPGNSRYQQLITIAARFSMGESYDGEIDPWGFEAKRKAEKKKKADEEMYGTKREEPKLS